MGDLLEKEEKLSLGLIGSSTRLPQNCLRNVLAGRGGERRKSGASFLVARAVVIMEEMETDR